MSYRLIIPLALILCTFTHASKPSRFRSAASRSIDASDSAEAAASSELSSEAATPVQYRYRPNTYEYSEEEEDYRRPAAQQTTIQSKKQQLRKQLEDEVNDEKEEPDRLQVLLGKSNFQCNDRVTGYYADESVACEVFHYCQDNSKHSWVCPEGFSFHQVHLICMPPSNDNICEQSSKYHVVNEYLYKPINMEEHQRKPNVTLRYSERYYPESVYYDDRRDYHEDRAPVRQQQVTHQTPRKQPVQNFHHVTTPHPSFRLNQQSTPQSFNQNAYRSHEDINISLQQRRPTAQPPRYEEEEDYSYEK